MLQYIFIQRSLSDDYSTANTGYIVIMISLIDIRSTEPTRQSKRSQSNLMQRGDTDQKPKYCFITVQYYFS